jgi:hypothetical protein
VIFVALAFLGVVIGSWGISGLVLGIGWHRKNHWLMWLGGIPFAFLSLAGLLWLGAIAFSVVLSIFWR